MKPTKILLVFAALTGVVLGNTASARDIYYVNDHLATTLAVIDDVEGEIAQLEADAFGTPISHGGNFDNPARYTGKPYDEDLGAYVFPFRNYRSEEGRWMSADPSGFPDGINSFIYAENQPWSLCDPWGLETYNVGPPATDWKISTSVTLRLDGKIDLVVDTSGKDIVVKKGPTWIPIVDSMDAIRTSWSKDGETWSVSFAGFVQEAGTVKGSDGLTYNTLTISAYMNMTHVNPKDHNGTGTFLSSKKIWDKTFTASKGYE